MNLWMRNEPLDTDVSGAAQFEGRTAEEAVARARAVLGDAGALRCWKTRRGGVGGFFAKEVFVAGLTPPPGSETTRSKASRSEPDEARGGSDRDPVPRAAPYDGTIRAADHLSGLVEATSDQVSLGSLAIPAEAFDEVLAEAQAALTHARARATASPFHALSRIRSRRPSQRRSQTSRSRSPHFPTTAAPGSHPTLASTRSPPAHRRRPTLENGRHRHPAPRRRPDRSQRLDARPPPPRSTTAAKHQRRSLPARIPDLRPGLRSLGVPDSYLPRGQRPSLDQLTTVMGTLPVWPALPTRAGAVVAVVASEPTLDRTVDLVAGELLLGQRDVLLSGGSPVATRLRSADLTSAEGATSRPPGRPTASKRPHIAAGGGWRTRRAARARCARAPRTGCSRLCPGGGGRALQEGGCRALGR